jgi:hypothetical protein
MPLIYASGATVRASLGHVLKGVEACEPKTGEVISIVELECTTSCDSPHELLRKAAGLMKLLAAMEEELQRLPSVPPCPPEP